MRLSEINPVDALKTVLVEQLTETIYVGNKPTSGLPNEYIDLYQNGGVNTNFSKMGMVKGFVLISINVKLMSNGSRNVNKEKLILGKFDELFSNNKTVVKDGYTFSLEPNNMVYGGGGIYEGYSTKLINLTFKYYGNN